MRSYIVRYAREEWSGWTGGNYSVMQAEDYADLRKRFEEEHRGERCRITEVIGWSRETGKRYVKKVEEAGE